MAVGNFLNSVNHIEILKYQRIKFREVMKSSGTAYRCALCGIFNNRFIANFSQAVSAFTFWQRHERIFTATFLTHCLIPTQKAVGLQGIKSKI